jgi:hypothetical protein
MTHGNASSGRKGDLLYRSLVLRFSAQAFDENSADFRGNDRANRTNTREF